MKAIVYERYGSPDVLRLRDVPLPTINDTEVLVRIHAAGVGAGDWHLLTAKMWVVRLFWGLTKPRRGILGFEVAGTVEAVGAKVTRFHPGDAVFGFCGDSRAGGFAEFAAVPEANLIGKPEQVSFEEAAVVPTSACTALEGLRDHGKVRPGSRVLINGASGGVGTYAIQIAKALGGDVTAVCSTGKVAQARSLGADRVIDYTQDNPTETGERYDVVLDNVGTWSLAVCKQLLTADGRYIAVAGGVGRLMRLSMAGGKQLTAFVSLPKQAHLVVLRDWLVEGTIRAVIDRRYPLADVPAAVGYVGEGHAAGKVVVGVVG